MKKDESVLAVSEGLLFLPYISGEQTPYPDLRAHAEWIGLTPPVRCSLLIFDLLPTLKQTG